ncbi:MAG: beta strand repeat-containing protein, partial [Planctomycetota bacterium]
MINLGAEGDVLILGMVGKVQEVNDQPTVEVAEVNIVSTSGTVFVQELVNSRDVITISGNESQVLDDALVKTRFADSEIYFQADGIIFVERSLTTLDRAKVDAASLVHFYGGEIRIDGIVVTQDVDSRIVLNAVDDITIVGQVTSGGDIEINAGVASNLTESESEVGGFALSDLSTGNLLLTGEAVLDAVGEVIIRAADDVELLAFAEIGDPRALPNPNIVQNASTVQVVTGSRQVEDGIITVPEVNWVTTTVTEQVGTEEVVVGSLYHTMDVVLAQDGYYNSNAPAGQKFRDYFVEGVDYFNLEGFFPTAVSGNTSSSNLSKVAGPPNDQYFDLRNNVTVTYDFSANPITNRSGQDFNVYELDGGSVEFVDMWVEVSENGSTWINVNGTAGTALTLHGDEAHGSSSFARGYDISGTGLSEVRFVRVVGTGVGYPGYGGFDLDAVGAPLDYWGGNAPNADDTFDQLDPVQKNVLLDFLGYKPLYNFNFTNAEEHKTIDGIPTTASWTPEFSTIYGDWSSFTSIGAPVVSVFTAQLENEGYINSGTSGNFTIYTGPLAETQKEFWVSSSGSWEHSRTTAEANIGVFDISIDGWDDKYIRMPVGAEEDVLRVVSQGTPTSWQETVGQYRDKAVVSYRQDKSAVINSYKSGYLGDIPWVVDYDNSPARWAVTYDSDGQREFTIYDDSRTVHYGKIPDWWKGSSTPYDENVYDVNGRYVKAPKGGSTYEGYIASTDTLSGQQEAQSYSYHARNPISGPDGYVGYDNFHHQVTTYTWSEWEQYWSDSTVWWSTASTFGWSNWSMSDPYNDWEYREIDSHPNLNNPPFRDDLYDQMQLTEWTSGYLDGTLNAAARGRYKIPESHWVGDYVDEIFHDYRYDWASGPEDIEDPRLTLNYMWVGNKHEIYGNRPKFETYETEVPVVTERQVTKWRTELIYEDQTVFTTERVFGDPIEFQAGVFDAESIIAMDAITIQTGRDVDISGKLLANGVSGSITIHAEGNATIEGAVPVDDQDALAAVSELNASSQISISSGAATTIATSGRLNVDDGGLGNTSGIALTAGTDVLVQGELFSLDDVVISAGDNVALESTITTGTLIDVNAGVDDGTGNITADIFAELSTIDGGAISLTAGATSGDINLVDSSVSTTGTVNLVAGGGSVFHGGGTIVAADLFARSAAGLTANTRVARVDASVSGKGNVLLTNGGDLVLTSLTAQDGSIDVRNFGGLTATHVETRGTSDANDILLTTYAVDQTASNLSFTVVSAGGDGDVTLNIEGAIDSLSTATVPNPVIAGDHLDVTIPGSLTLLTQVNALSVETTDAGNVAIDEADGLILVDVEVANGHLMVTAGGNLVAEDVRLLFNADDRDITLESTGGDIEIGRLQAGVYAVDAAGADVIQLQYFNAALRAIDIILPDDDDPTTIEDEDWTLQEAQDIEQRSDYGQIRSDLIALTAEADAILSLEARLTSFGDVTLKAPSGAIRELIPEDAGVDLIADEVILQAGTGITGLEMAANTLVKADTTDGDIELTDLDSVDEKIPGLTVIQTTAHDDSGTGSVSVSVEAQGTLNVGRFMGLDGQGQPILVQGSVDAEGVNSTVRLASTGDNLVVYGGSTVHGEGRISLLAGGLIAIEGNVNPTDWIEIRAGDTFRIAGMSDLSLTADTIMIETGQTINVDGTLEAKDLVELTSNQGNIIITGSIAGRDAAGLKELRLTARGTEPIIERLLDQNSGFARYQDSTRGQTYLRDEANNGFYRWQEVITGRYMFTGLNTEDPENVNVESFFSTTEDPEAGTLYFSDNSTEVIEQSKVLHLTEKYETVSYHWQEESIGRYMFTALNPASGSMEDFFSTTQDPGAGTLYYSDNSTVVSDPASIVGLSPKYILTEDGSILTPVTLQVSPGNVFLRYPSQHVGSQGTITTVTDLIRVDAQGGLMGQELSLDVTGPQGEIDITVGSDLTIDSASTIRADGRVVLASTGGALSVQSSSIAGHSGPDYVSDEVVLSAATNLTVGGTIAATNLISMLAGQTLEANLTVSASGPEGAIDIYSGNSLNLGSAILTATKRIALGSGGNLTVNGGNIGGTQGGNLAEVSLVAGGYVYFTGGNISATDLIDLKAGGTLTGTPNFIASGSDGTIHMEVADNLSLSSTSSFQAKKRIEVASLGNITVSGNPLKGIGASPVAELSLEAGGNLNVSGAAIAAGDLIRLHAGSALTANFNNLSASTIDLKSGASLNLGLANMTAATAIAIETGGSLTAAGRISTGLLTAQAANGVDIKTAVNEAVVHVTGNGNMQLNEADAIVLENIATANGAIVVTAAGTITAQHVKSLDDATGNDVTLKSTDGNLLIDYVATGRSHGRAILSAKGDLHEVYNHDPGIDLIAEYANLSAGGEITTTGNLALETDVGQLVTSDDLIINVPGDYVIDMDVETIVDVTAGGTIYVRHLTAGGQSVTLNAGRDIRIAYLDAGADLGTVSLTAGGSIYEGDYVEEAPGVYVPIDTYDAAPDLITNEAILSAGLNLSGGSNRDLDLETRLGSLQATATAGSIVMNEVDDMGLAEVSAGGWVGINAEGRLILSGSLSTGSSAELHAQGDIEIWNTRTAAGGISLISDGSGVATTPQGLVIGEDLMAHAFGEMSLNTQVARLTAASSSTGNLTINEYGALTLEEVSTFNGSIVVTAGGDLEALQVVSHTDDDANDITLTTTGGGIRAGAIDAGNQGDVALHSASAIADLAGKIRADQLLARAAGAMTLDTTVTGLDAVAIGAGGIMVTEKDGISLTR